MTPHTTRPTGQRPPPRSRSTPAPSAGDPAPGTNEPGARRADRDRGSARAARSASPVAFVGVSAHEPAEHLFRALLAAYLAGADEFLIRESPTVSEATREVARTFCRRTLGPEILSEGEGVLRLRDLSAEGFVPLERRVARMGRAVVELHRQAIESWSALPLREDGVWAGRDDEVDREAWCIERCLGRDPSATLDPGRLLGLFTVTRSLERIADHAVGLGEEGRRLAGTPSSSLPVGLLRRFHRQAMDHLEGALAARDASRANELLDTGEALTASGRALADRLLPAVHGEAVPPTTVAAVARILDSILRTIAYAQDIAEVALDRVPVAELGDRRARPSRAPLASAA